MLIDNADDFAWAIAELATCRDTCEGFVVDTETTGLDMFARENPARMVGIAITPITPGHRAFYFNFRHADSPAVPIGYLVFLQELLRDKTWYCHNGNFDVEILHCDGFELPPELRDTLTASHLVDENEDSYALKKLARKYFGTDSAAADDALHAELRARKLKKGDIAKLPASVVAPYAIADVELTRQLYWDRLEHLKKWRLEDLYAEVSEFQLALIRCEIRGIFLDQDEVHRQIESLGPRLLCFKERLYELAGRRNINFNSPVQLKAWLGLQSTAKQVLEEELQRNPREDIRTLLDYRSLMKAESTYFRPFLEMVDRSSRLHTSYKVFGTVSGRLSSSEPNLQNISREQGNRTYSVKKCLAAAPGHFLLECDYSAIEPRIAAHFSMDPTMLDAFRRGLDFHSQVARSMFHKQDISKDERTSAKTLGLGVLYGMGSQKAAVKLNLRHEKNADGTWQYCYQNVWGLSPEGVLTEYPCSYVNPEFCTAAGKGYRQKFYAGLPELEPFFAKVRSTAARNGYVRIPIGGRCRRFEESYETHKSPNSIIQGTAAAILQKAFVALDKRYQDVPDGPRIVLTVHDSLVFEVPFGPNAERYCREVKETMETIVELQVPLVVDAKIGYNLSNMADFKT